MADDKPVEAPKSDAIPAEEAVKQKALIREDMAKYEQLIAQLRVKRAEYEYYIAECRTALADIERREVGAVYPAPPARSEGNPPMGAPVGGKGE